MLELRLQQTLHDVIASNGFITVLTGAGVSAESDIPTFRGPEGYWTIGSRNYQPQEISNYAMFLNRPEDVWKWFLYRRGVCLKAEPNAGHHALAEMELMLDDRFQLITQNVDGLHLRARSSAERTFQVHGNLNYMRCAEECSLEIYAIPDEMPAMGRDEELPAELWQRLICPKCGRRARPHVLLWDETYNEPHYRFESSLKAAEKTDLLLIVGSTGSTNLPHHVLRTVLRNNGVIVDINIERNAFSEIALGNKRGFFVKAHSSTALSAICEIVRKQYVQQEN
ncbi:MAG: NAD-dependent deacetylase [Planctomycetota bacterium]|nr:NAD-dependent deacetylase [Planctomycetota bacterium]MDA1211911.1 NAD-dependent deacetylase [Planctomycetota bacterium]